MNPTTAIRLLQSTEFLIGAAAGLVLLVLLVVSRGRLDWGVSWTIAGVSALWMSGRTGGIGLNAFIGATWLSVVTAAAIATAAALWRWRDHDMLAFAWAVSLGGIWATVPDTEEVSILLGAAVVLMWSAWPLGHDRISPLSTVLLPTLALAAGMAGSAGRPPAIVGMIGSLGVLALMGVPAGQGRRLDLVFHTGFVLAWSRVAGSSDSVATAIAVGAAATVALFGLKLMVSNHESEDQRTQETVTPERATEQ